jgi:isoquinoline 1-oxidoreductase alpha subunit
MRDDNAFTWRHHPPAWKFTGFGVNFPACRLRSPNCIRLPRAAMRIAADTLSTQPTENSMIRFTVNGERLETDVAPDTPLLWFLRDNLQLTGTKFGCGIALCGACTVHVNGEPVRACVMPLSALAGKRVTTIEEIGKTPVGKKVQDAWIAEDVVQCGYCQSGQVMAATALLAKTRTPTDAEIEEAMNGIICRCGTYNRIRSAIKVAAGPGAATLKPAAKAKA